MKKKLKIIIDNNLWISFLINNDFDFIDRYLISDQLKSDNQSFFGILKGVTNDFTREKIDRFENY
jgi:predicted nucleic acid-binding protein